ncbi:MAK10-like protein [Tanacetum coccineum]
MVQNGCSFHRLCSEDPNQHLKDFLKLVDSLDLDGDNREERACVYFNFPFAIKLAIGLNAFQQDPSPHGGSYYLIPCSLLSTGKDRKTLQRYPDVPTTSRRIFIRSMDLFQGLTLKSLSSWHRSLAPSNRIASRCPEYIRLPSNRARKSSSTLDEAHLAPTQPTQVNKITTSYAICSGLHNTQYCMIDPERAFVEYASSRTNEARGKWYTFKPEQNNLGDTYNPSWKSRLNLRWRQPQNSQNNFSNPPNQFQPNGSFQNCSFNNRPQNFNNQSNIEGLVSEFMTSQDARFSKFEADFKRQQSDMTNKINTVLKAITDQIAGTLPSNTVKNPKLGTHPQPMVEIKPQQPEEPKPTLEIEFKDFHLNLPVLEVLAHAPIYNVILDKYVEILELGKNGSAFVQGEIPGSCVNIIPLYLFKKLNIRLLEKTDHIFGLADGTKSYPVGIVKDVEVHIGKLKLFNDFYVLDMKKDPETPLLVGRGFLAT